MPDGAGETERQAQITYEEYRNALQAESASSIWDLSRESILDILGEKLKSNSDEFVRLWDARKRLQYRDSIDFHDYTQAIRAIGDFNEKILKTIEVLEIDSLGTSSWKKIVYPEDLELKNLSSETYELLMQPIIEQNSMYSKMRNAADKISDIVTSEQCRKKIVTLWERATKINKIFGLS